MENIYFEYPYFFFLFLLPFLLVLQFYIFKVYQKSTFILYPTPSLLSPNFFSEKIRPHFIFWLHILGISLLILASTNPIARKEMVSVKQYGFDMVLALDASDSMLTPDFKPQSRFQASKMILEEFIKKRENDRIGLVVFGADAYIQAPQTMEYEPLLEILRSLSVGSVDPRRTAIGSALAISASRLLDSKAKNKIILLITDGVDTANKVSPLAAAEAIEELEIRVYTIGIGNPYFTRVNFDVLKEIAEKTEGRFYRARSTRELQLQLNEIDQLEKSLLGSKKYQSRKEYTLTVIAWGIFFLLLAIFIDKVLWPRRT